MLRSRPARIRSTRRPRRRLRPAALRSSKCRRPFRTPSARAIMLDVMLAPSDRTRLAIVARRGAVVVALVAAALGGADAQAQMFPSHPVRFLAPYSAGAGPAVFTKVVGDKLAQLWAQPVIV